MKARVTAVATVFIVVALVTTFGGLAVTPSPAGYGVSIESDFARVQMDAQRNQTERARIAAAADIAITEQREQTARVVVPLALLTVGATVAAVAWSRRPHRPAAPPAQLVMYVASHYLPGQASVVQVNGEWAVVDHERREIVPARLLLGVES